MSNQQIDNGRPQRNWPLGVALLALTWSACPAAPVVVAIDAGPPDAGAVAPKPADLKFSLRAQVADGGWADVSFEAAARPFIEPTQTLRVGSNLGLSNFRIRVFDEADRAMISDDEEASTDEKTPLDYLIRFASPLKTGHRYTLVVDAQTGTTFNDALGRGQPDQRLDFQIIGQREKDSPKKTQHPRHHR